MDSLHKPGHINDSLIEFGDKKEGTGQSCKQWERAMPQQQPPTFRREMKQSFPKAGSLWPSTGPSHAHCQATVIISELTGHKEKV